MAGFIFRLETRDGEPAESKTLSVAVPNWDPGDVVHTRGKAVEVHETNLRCS